MATLTVEGVPPGLLRRLATTAVANGRCLNSEVILSLLRHVRETPLQKESPPPGVSVCPLLPWLRSEAPPGLNVSWGDPG